MIARTLLALALTGLLTSAAFGADEVRWRYDYAAARNEAAQTGRPIMIDFSTDWCTYCKKLDVTTFRDSHVIRTLNEQFIPVKLDGNREKRLVEALRIQGYPTLILAGPDGKIIKTVEGYLDATKFSAVLQETLASVSDPEWMAKSFLDAHKAVLASEYGTAVSLLKTIVEDGKQRGIQVQARRLLVEIEEQAAGQLARARQLEAQKQYLEAVDLLAQLSLSYHGTQASTEAAKELARLGEMPEVKTLQRSRRAAELLRQARSDYRELLYLSCVDRCMVLAGKYGDLPEGAEAARLLDEIKANPEWMKSACERLQDQLGELYLALAESWVNKGEPQLAIECLQRVIAAPGSRHAEPARVRLAQIQGQPKVTAPKSEANRAASVPPAEKLEPTTRPGEAPPGR